MSKDKKTDTKQTQKKKGNVGHKGAIVGLSIALALVTTAGVVTPLVGIKQGWIKVNSKTHTVKFNTTISGVTTPDQQIEDGKLATKPSISAVNSKTVKFWKTDDGKVWDFSKDVVKSDITLTAVWGDAPVGVAYTVVFDTLGGPTVNPSEVPAGSKATKPYVDPWKKDNETLEVKSWTLDDKPYDFNTPVEADITLKAVWGAVPPSAEWRTVTFKVDDGAVYKTESIKVGDTAIKPESPTKSGYSFKEWVDATTKKIFDFSTPITQDVVLEATWDEVVVVTHTVTFHTTDYQGNEGGKFADGSSSKTGECNDNDFFIVITKPGINISAGYNHIGWTDSSGNDISALQITKDIDAYAKYTVEEKTVALNLSTTNTVAASSDYQVKVRGQQDYNYKKTDGKKYKDIKNNLPVAVCTDPTAEDTFTFAHWSLDPQVDFTSPNPEPGDDEVIGSGEDAKTVLYPQFTKDKKAVTVELTIHLIEGQTLKSGSTEIKVPYNETNPTTFGEINKPEVFEGTKTFSGNYYHNYDETTKEFSNKWNSDDEITPSTDPNIYIEMETPITQPEITFTVEDDAEELPKYKWVGNHENIRCEKDTAFGNISAPNVYYKDAVEDPDPTIGFKTSYYFGGWYYKKGDEKVDVTNTTKITQSMTLYAQFIRKTQVVIEIEEVEEGSTPQTVTVEALPTTKWSDIVKPDVTTLSKTTRFLTGWKATSLEEGSDPIIFDANTTISSIPLVDDEAEVKQTVHVVPIISDKVNTIEFVTEPKTESGTKVNEVWYQGSTKVGVDMSKTINVTKDVNKPALPLYDEASEEKKNQGFTFDDRWEIKGGTFTDWTTVTENTEIPAVEEGGSAVAYQMRPIVNGNVNITFDPTTDGQLETGSIATISVGTSKKFSEMYKPICKPTTEKAKDITFKCWNTKDTSGELMEVQPGDSFPADTTLYASYTKNNVQSTIHYKVTEKDLKDTDFPAYLNEDNCFAVSITHESGKAPKVSEFGDKMPTKKKHHFVSWGEEVDGKIVKVDPNKEVGSGSYPDPDLVLYAMFEPNASTYHKVTIDSQSGVYIEGPTTFYVGDGEKLPINGGSFEIITDENEISAWTVGKNLSGWTCDGKPVTGETVVTDDMVIAPSFTAPNQQPLIHFQKPEGVSLTSEQDVSIDINAELLPTLAIAAPTAIKSKADFVKWQILGTDGVTLTDITSETRVRNNMLKNNTITLVPIFMDESIYEGIDGAYFYDEGEEKWGTIQSYFYEGDSSCLKVQYQDGEVKKVSKTSFDYEIKFGKQTTCIPDYFMFGCNKWNNGGKPLVFPAATTSIGKDVMFGCTSFNQPITSDISAGLPTDPYRTSQLVFTIGENFMKNCYSFDSSIDLNYKGEQTNVNFIISDGFMSECQKLGKSGSAILNLTGWQGFGLRDTATGKITYAGSLSAADFYSCLSTTMEDPYTITVKLDKGVPDLFKHLFPDLDDISITPYHRKTKTITD